MEKLAPRSPPANSGRVFKFFNCKINALYSYRYLYVYHTIETDEEYQQFFVLKYEPIYITKKIKFPAEYKFYLRQLQFK
jgi:hypothetical protein